MTTLSRRTAGRWLALRSRRLARRPFSSFHCSRRASCCGRAEPAPRRSGRVPLLEVAVREGRRGVHGHVQQLLGRRPGRRPPGGFEVPPGHMAPAHPRREQFAELTDDVVLRVAQASDELFRLFPGPRSAAGRQGQPRLARPATQDVVRQDPLDVPGIEPVGELLGQRLVHPAQEFGLPEAERGIGTCPAQVGAAGVDAQNGRETCPEQAGRATAGHGDHVDVIRRDVLRPRVQDGERVMRVPEPRLAAAVPGRPGVDHPVKPFFPPGRSAALDLLLPFGGQQGREVTHGQDDVHLGREQGPDGPVGLTGGAHREQFV